MFISHKKKMSLALGASLLAVSLPTAHAQNVNVQFVGGGAPASTEQAAANDGSFWNAFDLNVPGASPGTTKTGLKDSNGGTTTAVGFTFISTGGTGGPNTGGILPTDAPSLTSHYVYSPSGSTITITGLGAQPYNLYLYGVATVGSTFTVNGTPLSNSPATTTHALTQGVDYVKFAGVTPTAGQIVVNLASANSSVDSNSHVNGFQLQAAPEPSQTAALGLGVLGLVGGALKAHKRRSA